jgi:hypothetical protein
MAFISLLAITPIVIALLSFFVKRKIYTFKRAAYQCFVTLTIATAGAMIQMHRHFNDTEVISGVVTGRTTEKRPCQHKGEHEYDKDWLVHFSTGESVTIKREDPQGRIQPDRWILAQIPEPASFLRAYPNYVKGMPEEIFKYNDVAAVEKYKDVLPSYPRLIYDYYRVNRLVPVNFPKLPDRYKKDTAEQSMQRETVSNLRGMLTTINSRIGTDKEANVILVLVSMLQDDFFSAIKSHWRGAKKNDIVVVIGIDKTYTIRWASAMAPADNESYPSQLSEAIMKVKKIKDKKEQEQLIGAIEKSVRKDFKRRHFDDMDYLLMTTIPSRNFFAFVMLFAVFVNMAMSITYYRRTMAAQG